VSFLKIEPVLLNHTLCYSLFYGDLNEIIIVSCPPLTRLYLAASMLRKN